MMGILIGAIVVIFAVGSFTESDKALLERAQKIFQPLKAPKVLPGSIESQQIELGRKLFFDPRLSGDGTVSCASCHKPSHYGADNTPRSVGVFNKPTSRNTPSVFNLKHSYRFHWRGDRDSLEDQTLRVFTDPEGLGNPNQQEALRKLHRAGYSGTLQTAAATLVRFQESLITEGSAFDRFLEGDIEALTKKQKQGLKKFIHLGCVVCHSGPAFGGNDLVRFGLTKEYWTVTKSQPSESGHYDKGRYAVTGNTNDRNVFKVPSLRNVAKTSPYFHDGSAPDLATAVRWMAELQLDHKLTDEDVDQIKSFLESLTGNTPESFQQIP